MALDLPGIPTLGSLWNWSKDSIEIWCRAMSNLTDVISKYDLAKYDTFVASMQFSFFPVFVGWLLFIPYEFVMKAGKYGSAIDVIIDFVLMYLLVFGIACAQKLSSVIVRGHGSLRASLTLALFGTAYIPILTVLDYSALLNKEQAIYLADTGKLPPSYHPIHEVIGYVIFGIFTIFLILRFVPAPAYVHRVGKVRASIICVLTLMFTELLYVLVFDPMEAMLMSLT